MSEEEAAKMPDPSDLDSVGNREWLWQREYTTLELQVCRFHIEKNARILTGSVTLQHRLKRAKPLSHSPPDEPGFRGFAVAVSKNRFEKLRSEAIRESEDEVWGNRLHLRDPDGTDVTVVIQSGVE